MSKYTEQDFRDFGEDQGFKWDEGFSLDCLVTFKCRGKYVVNPYSYMTTESDPAELFGDENMAEWKKEAAELMDEWEADAA